jgi:hypothetical protein
MSKEEKAVLEEPLKQVKKAIRGRDKQALIAACDGLERAIGISGEEGQDENSQFDEETKNVT